MSKKERALRKKVDKLFGGKIGNKKSETEVEYFDLSEEERNKKAKELSKKIKKISDEFGFDETIMAIMKKVSEECKKRAERSQTQKND